ncbi:MAG: RDD family protein [Myxococcota bacterium]
MSELPGPQGVHEAGGLHESSPAQPRQVVRSAEQVHLDLPVAGPTSRMLAYLIDALLLVIWMGLLFVLLALLTPLLFSFLEPLRQAVDELGQGQAGEPSSLAVVLVIAVALVFFLVSELSYFVFWEAVTGGRSPGKAALGLRVVRDGGRPLDFPSSLLRNLLRVVDYLPVNYLTGFIAMLVSPEGKRLGDLAAGTLVVRLDRPAAADPLHLDEDPRDGTFRFERGQVSRVGRTERALLRRTLRRVDVLAPERADAALDRAVEVLRVRIGYPEEVIPAERKTFLRALLRASSR